MKGGPQKWDELEEKRVSVKRACISLDGTRIAAVSADKTLCIYDTTTGEAIFPPCKVDELVWATALRGIYESYNFLLTNEESSRFFKKL